VPSDLWDRMFSRSGMLLAEATQHKRDGDIDAAIATLRAAYIAAGQESVDHGIEAHLRLPLYLHAAARVDEAWTEFNKLVVAVYPGHAPHRTRRMLLAELSAIFDKMRLTLQRDGLHAEAVKFGVWSMLCYIGERASPEFLGQSDDWIRRKLISLLKKAKRTDLIDPIHGLVIDMLQREKFRLDDFGLEIDALLNVSPTSAYRSLQ
jgi:hypothetical protein